MKEKKYPIFAPMKTVFKQHISGNSYFFIPSFLFLGIGLLLSFWQEKGGLVLFFSQHRSPFGDAFFAFWTHLGEAIPFFAAAILLYIFPKYRFYIRHLLLISAGALLISYFLKLFFQQPRPLPYFEQIGVAKQLDLVEGVYVNTGLTSFPSGHTLAAFALYSLLAIVYPHRLWSFICFTIAALVGISRIYLVQHFTEDVLLGAVLGLSISLSAVYIFHKAEPIA